LLTFNALMRTAILDLGTNTFNLLITETSGSGAKILLSRKEPVKLGQAGITRGIIAGEAFERGMEALRNHMRYINQYGAGEIHAFATSAIRSARNGAAFARALEENFGIEVVIISGEKEAEFIYHGVRQAVNMDRNKYLIVDIGGGSNELIIANNEKIFRKESFPLGMARLLERFRPSDPITREEILAIENYISQSLGGFIKAAMKHNVATLIGSSGSFDTFRALLSAQKKSDNDDFGHKPCFKFTPADFSRLYGSLVNSTAGQRLAMEGMEPMRVEMIVIAGIFVNFIIRRLNIRSLIQSDYSLKEGAAACILQQNVLYPDSKISYPAD
jgi:exopolyphosphatase / guanosine-5'-triphosphate,3'-diphosphate pyrophosphatase